MTTLEALSRRLVNAVENEHLEFKEAKQQYVRHHQADALLRGADECTKSTSFSKLTAYPCGCGSS